MDKEINERTCQVFRPNQDGTNWRFQDIQWQYIEVGDIVKITNEKRAFPAGIHIFLHIYIEILVTQLCIYIYIYNIYMYILDMLLLQSSTNQGLCNIETSNLDGETNLKIKQAVGATYSIAKGEMGEMGDRYPKNADLQFKLISEAPNEEIHRWKGTLYIRKKKGEFKENSKFDEPVSVNINQFLLRGCTLRNTDWVIAVVVFTGVESKLALNNKEAPFKRSHVDLVVDFAIYCIFFVQFCLCVFGVISHLIWLNKNAKNEWYQYINSDGSQETNFIGQALLNYGTFLVLLDLFVPISLYVSIEVVKVAQAILINNDEKMTYTDQDKVDDTGKPRKLYAQARTSNLNEELGQVSFIFSDKTGTLTENKMEFLKCHISDDNGKRYGPGEMELQNDFVDRVAAPDDMPPFNPKKCRFTDNRLAANCQTNNIINEFLTLLSVCHSIIPEYPDGPDGEIVYNASSPDEKALVILAKNLHYYFYEGHVQILEFRDKKIDGHKFYINIFGDKHDFDVYNMLEFSSARKRMSVIVKDPRDKKFKLYIKGADNVIYQRLADEYKGNKWDKTLESLKYFAAEGLRTLVCAYKEISDNEYFDWLDRLNKAQTSFDNRDVLVDQLYDEMENNLVLLGATAIEDKLQDGVPETIKNLAIAGISLWVLTGDKVETAINIGRSAKLLKPSMNEDDKSLIVIDPEEKISKQNTKAKVDHEFKEAWNYLKNKIENNPNQGFVISGKALSVVFPARKHDKKGKEIPPTDDELKEEIRLQELLLKICRKCRAVICCRVSPIQKAQVVKLVKNNIKGTITLAIGDGANDVPMIKAAHVGIGISGQEGLQAVMASDYAISQFKHLKELLLIHGAWNYRRIAILILYSFYKNITFSMTQVWFSIYSGFSGTLFYDGMSGSCYNLIYTAFPVLFLAVLDRPYSKEIANVCPELYENGPKNGSFSVKIFLQWVFEGVIHSMLIFWGNAQFIDSQTLPDGKIVGFWVSATTQFTSLVMVVNAKIMLETKTWTSWTIIMFFLSVLSWYIFTLVWSSMSIFFNSNFDIYFVSQMSMRMPQFWFCVILTIGITMVPTILYKYLKKMYNPTMYDMIEELELYPIQRREFLDKIKEHTNEEKKQDIIDNENMINRPRKMSTQHLGFSEFQVGRDHPDFVMSQKKYISIRLPFQRLISKKSKKQQKNYNNVSINDDNKIQEETPKK